ncbi:hypothetical protein [Streptomyces sp. NPDC005408]|uniref:hypothetical protein n=1 Tax=Streptomyces sp. NPDC005408 TaxID=3155341 RepID=UPI0033B945F5
MLDQVQRQLAAVRKRIEARPSISDLEASIQGAELASHAEVNAHLRAILSRAEKEGHLAEEADRLALIQRAVQEGGLAETADLLAVLPSAEQEGRPSTKTKSNPTNEN